MVYYTHQVGEGSHAVIHFYETHRLVGVGHALNNNLQALSHWDHAIGICLKLVLQNRQTYHWEGQMNRSSSRQEPTTFSGENQIKTINKHIHRF